MKLNSLILSCFLIKTSIKEKKINKFWKFKRKFQNMIKKAISFKKTVEEVKQVIYLNVFVCV